MELTADTRTITGKKVKALRRQHLIPAVVYGQGQESRSVSVPEALFLKAYRTAGESALIDLNIAGEILKALIKQVAREPVSGKVFHVDFQRVTMTRKLKTQVPIVLAGDAPAVKEHGAVLVLSLDHLEIECLPQDLIPDYTVHVAGLAKVGDMIRVRDLVVPPGIRILTKPDATIVVAEAPKVEEEVPAAVPVDVSAVQTEQEVKREEKKAKLEEEKKIE